MISAADMLDAVFHEVRALGECTNEAQSAWGADRYERNGVVVQLEDEGYTMRVVYGDRLNVSHTYGRALVFERGDQDELWRIYRGLVSCA